MCFFVCVFDYLFADRKCVIESCRELFDVDNVDLLEKNEQNENIYKRVP